MPYTQPENEIKYTHKDSRQLPSVIHQISLSLESRLSTLSYNGKIFQGSPSPYHRALQNSDYKHTPSYEHPKYDINSANVNKQERNRKRQIIWFNPLFNLKTKTKTGKSFLKLLDKHFPTHTKLDRLFNHTIVKFSQSCMPSINSYIYMHNHKQQT